MAQSGFTVTNGAGSITIAATGPLIFTTIENGSGAVSFALDPEQPFTPYGNLTEAQVVGWVQGVYGSAYVTSLEASVSEDVALLANPPIVTPPLPWSAA